MTKNFNRFEFIKKLFKEAQDLNPDDLDRFLKEKCLDSQMEVSVRELLKEEVSAPLMDSFASAITDEFMREKDSTEEQELQSPNGYVIRRELGRGGFGIVFLASQPKMGNRHVAMKFLLPSRATDMESDLFRKEINNMSLMEHENIARIYEASEFQRNDAHGNRTKTLFYSMEYVENSCSIIKYCDGNELSIRKRLELFVQLCQAVHHAHNNRIVHRDLTPNNVLVQEREGRPIVKLIDFGLGDYSRTLGKSEALGTLGYASPEQVVGGETVSALADIFSLGSILQKLLIGKNCIGNRPNINSRNQYADYVQGGVMLRASEIISACDPNTLNSICHNRSISYRRLIWHLWNDLDSVIAKCLQKEPSKRYNGANALADDIVKFIQCKPLSAIEKSSFSYRATKFVWRSPVISLATFIVLALSVVLSFSIYQTNREYYKRADEAYTASIKERGLRLESEKAKRNAESGFEALAGIFDELNIREPPESKNEWASTFASKISQAGMALNSEIFDDSTSYLKVIDRLSGILLGLGDGENAIVLAKKAKTGFYRKKGISAYVLDSLAHNLALAYRANREYSNAIDAFQECLETVENRPVGDRKIALRCRAGIAECHLRLGSPEIAERMLAQLIQHFKDEFGATNIETLAVMGTHAESLPINRAAFSKTILEEIIAIMEKKYGFDSYHTLTAKINLSLVLLRLRDHDACIDLLAELIPLAKKTMGINHPKTILAKLRLANEFVKTKQNHKARTELESIDVKYQVENADPATRVQLLSLFNAIGDSKNSMLLKQMLFDWKNDVEKDRALVSALSNYGVDLVHKGEHSEAMLLLEATLKESTQRLGIEDEETVLVMSNIGFAKGMAGELETAFEIFETAIVASRKRCRPMRQLEIARSYASFVKLGKASIAPLMLLESSLKPVLSNDHRAVQMIRSWIGVALIDSRRFVEGSEYLAGPMSYTIDQLAKESPIVLTAIERLGVHFYRTDLFHLSVPLFEKMHEVRLIQSNGFTGDSKLLNAKHNLALNYRLSGRSLASVKLYEELYSYGRGLPYFSSIKNGLCFAYFENNMGVKAYRVVDELISDLRENFKSDEDLDSFVYGLRTVADRLSESGGYEQAKELLGESISLLEAGRPNHWRLFAHQMSFGHALFLEGTIGTKNGDPATSKSLLGEANNYLILANQNIERHFAEIPKSIRKKMLTESVTRLLRFHEFTGDSDSIEKWKSKITEIKKQYGSEN